MSLFLVCGHDPAVCVVCRRRLFSYRAQARGPHGRRDTRNGHRKNGRRRDKEEKKKEKAHGIHARRGAIHRLGGPSCGRHSPGSTWPARGAMQTDRTADKGRNARDPRHQAADRPRICCEFVPVIHGRNFSAGHGHIQEKNGPFASTQTIAKAHFFTLSAHKDRATGFSLRRSNRRRRKRRSTSNRTIAAANRRRRRAVQGLSLQTSESKNCRSSFFSYGRWTSDSPTLNTATWSVQKNRRAHTSRTPHGPHTT